ncbi:DUF1326 domain-containing protein [Haloplanus halophilus]|uniref:DUF1326 domain-containing protein n=1 Tax=Haloplanus halophilus TaxID=2949993 RepID=UPI00203E0635|nr:DUF1326 domain-containing protein [Haloplanus sp. GDY1]
MTSDWTIAGDYVEACNCDVACQCIWMEPADDDGCIASLAWHIREGEYGDVDLRARSVAMLITAEEGVMFAPETGWDVVLVVDEAADDEQRAAIEDVFLGRAGGIWAAVADAHVESVEVTTAPIEFARDGDEFSVSVGDIATMEAAGAPGFNGELGRVSPHPLTKSQEMIAGKSTTATASYGDGFDWDVSGNNAYLGDFELASA